MAGNVWEWVATLFMNYPYDVADGRENTGSSGIPVFRGGSWMNSNWNLRSAYRNRANPDSLAYDLGFRCASDATE